MPYIIKWHPKAKKKLLKLPEYLKKRVIRKFKDFRKDPFRYLEHYEGNDFYKFRIGNYRALIDVNLPKKLLKVQVFDHRDKIYKRL